MADVGLDAGEVQHHAVDAEPRRDLATSTALPLAPGPDAAPARVSSARCGACGVIRLPPGAGVCRRAEPPDHVDHHMGGCPAFTRTFTDRRRRTRATTRLGTVWPAVKFRLEVAGRGLAAGVDGEEAGQRSAR